MIKLSLSAINANSPYQLRLSTLGGFDFCTDFGIEYNIALIEDSSLAFDGVYMLNILPCDSEKYLKNRKLLKHDIKIRQTVFAVLKEFFRQNEGIIDYVCLTQDERQTYRNRLFKMWFNKYAGEDFAAFYTSLGDNYMGAIIKKDNPQYTDFDKAFKKFDEDIHKPEPWEIDIDNMED